VADLGMYSCPRWLQLSWARSCRAYISACSPDNYHSIKCQCVLCVCVRADGASSSNSTANIKEGASSEGYQER